MLSLGSSKDRSTGRDLIGLQVVVSIECYNKTTGACCRATTGCDETTTTEADPTTRDHGYKTGEAKVGTSGDEATK